MCSQSVLQRAFRGTRLGGGVETAWDSASLRALRPQHVLLGEAAFAAGVQPSGCSIFGGLTALVGRRHGPEDGATNDFEALLAATQEARQFLQHARMRYEQHLAVDGC